MEHYTVYSMIQPNGIIKVKAILNKTVPHNLNPTDFFLVGSTDLKTIGTFNIEGSASHYLDDSFEIQTMRKKITLTADFVTYVDIPDGASREQTVAKAKAEINIRDTKRQKGQNPILFKEGTVKITRVSSMQPREDLFGNIDTLTPPADL